MPEKDYLEAHHLHRQSMELGIPILYPKVESVYSGDCEHLYQFPGLDFPVVNYHTPGLMIVLDWDKKRQKILDEQIDAFLVDISIAGGCHAPRGQMIIDSHPRPSELNYLYYPMRNPEKFVRSRSFHDMVYYHVYRIIQSMYRGDFEITADPHDPEKLKSFMINLATRPKELIWSQKREDLPKIASHNGSLTRLDQSINNLASAS